jgi:hypothetical protein
MFGFLFKCKRFYTNKIFFFGRMTKVMTIHWGFIKKFFIICKLHNGE